MPNLSKKQKEELKSALIKDVENEYSIFVYSDVVDEIEALGIKYRKDNSADYKFHANSKRQVVGLMKTIMDNFHPHHVDIISHKSWLLGKVG